MIFSINGTNVFYLCFCEVFDPLNAHRGSWLAHKWRKVDYVRWLVSEKFCTQKEICWSVTFSWLWDTVPLLAAQWQQLVVSIPAPDPQHLRECLVQYTEESIARWYAYKCFLALCTQSFSLPFLFNIFPTDEAIPGHMPRPAMSMNIFQGMPQALRMMCKVWHAWAHTLYYEKRLPKSFVVKIKNKWVLSVSQWGTKNCKTNAHWPLPLHIFFLTHPSLCITRVRLSISLKQCSDFKCIRYPPGKYEKPTHSTSHPSWTQDSSLFTAGEKPRHEQHQVRASHMDPWV